MAGKIYHTRLVPTEPSSIPVSCSVFSGIFHDAQPIKILILWQKLSQKFIFVVRMWKLTGCEK